MDDLKYWVALHRVSGLGPLRFGKLEACFASMEEAWGASRAGLTAAGLDVGTVEDIVSERAAIDPDAEMTRLADAGVRAIHRRSAEYPVLLAEVYAPPSVIYVKGSLTEADRRGVAVVGTRGPTSYGREMAHRLAYDLAKAGVTVMSGLARGIDGTAHKAALEAGGRTVAVMGGGLESIYPPEHLDLARNIAESGAVVSEYPLGTKPKAEHFPRRNRVVSGLALGVLVVESDMEGGAMLTVKWALEQDREVFAVPGSALSPKSAGPSWLIQQGAKLVVECEDVLEELNIAVLKPGEPSGRQLSLDRGSASAGGTTYGGGPGTLDIGVINDGVESTVLTALSGAPMHVDDVTRAVGLPASAVSSAIAMLELRGQIRQTGPMQYVASRQSRR